MLYKQFYAKLFLYYSQKEKINLTLANMECLAQSSATPYLWLYMRILTGGES